MAGGRALIGNGFARRILLSAAVITGAGGIADAQSLGQWWWTGHAGLTGTSFANQVDGGDTTSSSTNWLRLSIDFNGYILHPAVGEFRLGIDTALSGTGGSFSLDTQRWGYRTDLSLLPYSSTPIEITFGQTFLDYSNPSVDDAIALTGAVDTVTNYGIFANARGTIFRGTQIGFSRQIYSFTGPATSDEIQESSYAQWSRSTRNFRHAISLDRDYHLFGTTDFEIDNITLTVDEGGQLAPEWTWTLYGFAIRRHTDTVASSQTANIANVTNRFDRQFGVNRLQINYVAAFSSRGQGDTWSHRAAGSYNRNLKSGLTMSTGMGYAWQRGPTSTSKSLSGSAGINYRRHIGRVALSVGASVGASQSRSQGADGDRTGTSIGASAQTSITHSSRSGWQQQLDVTWGTSEFRRVEEDLVDLPDLGTSIAGFATSDSLRGRLGVSRKWRGVTLNLHAESQRRESSDEGIRDFSFIITQSNARASLTWSNFSAIASAILNSGEVNDRSQGTTRSLSASMGWSPWRTLRVGAVASISDRQGEFTSNVLTERFEVSAGYSLGLLNMSLRVFESTVSPRSGGARTGRGVVWSINRSFGGLLPVVSAPRRRGTIR